MITVPKTIPPPILYKYYSPERANVIVGLEAHFSPPSKFNDAFDTYHLLPRTSDNKAKIKRGRLRNAMGIFCLTERPDNHMMWVNYAKGHTGFVIGFDSASPFFEEDGRELRKVIYQPKPPVFIEADENGCFFKSPEWQYEEEWRCVRRFNREEQRSVSFEWPMVKEIIFGNLMERWMISQIVQHATVNSQLESLPMPLFFSSVPSHSEWRFVKKESHIALCEACGGDGYVSMTPTFIAASDDD
jgi:Protein of unknown function (DUF2971)